MQTQVEVANQPELHSMTAATIPQSQPRWSLGLRLGFRFAFVYFLLYCFPFPLGSLPYTDKPAEWYELGWHKVVPWVAKHVLRLAQPITIFSNGSGDTTYDYVKVFCFLVLAAVAVLVWSALDRKRASYSRLYQWLRFYVRLTLGATLLSYGGYKVVPSQFPPLFQWRYLQTYGESSPMGILWTFMSASKSYTIFAGAVEMLGGILLFIPRLATLGTLIGIGAIANVFMLNMSYDVPVKLYSFHLLLMGFFLVLPEIRRLARFFVFNRPTEPAAAELRFQRHWLNHGMLFAQIAVGLFFGGYALYSSHQQLKSYVSGDFPVKSLYGTWGVDEFSVDGQPRPPLLTDEMRWQKIVVNINTALAVQGMDGKLIRFQAKMDLNKKTIELTKQSDPKWKASLTYELPTPQTMIADGQIGTQTIHIKLHHLDEQYLLNTRGFHWINELPFNR
ncbi:MAG TPA: hypothetical protein VGK24_12915 [Candidatus Angelobacter sp.]|jgi:hypothetical protein